MKLFDIPTTVSANRNEGEITSVGVVADRPTRELIWEIVHREEVNPIAECKGLSHTTLLLSPHEGYTGEETASMTFAVVCLARVGWTPRLFNTYVGDMVGAGVVVEDFVPMIEIVREVQNRYSTWKSLHELSSQLDPLRQKLSLLQTKTEWIVKWRDEAIECERRLGRRDERVSGMVDEVCGYSDQARDLYQKRRGSLRDVEARIEAYKVMMETNKMVSVDVYHSIVEAIAIEIRSVERHINTLTPFFNKIQNQLMIDIRRATPPAK
jgi:hypothetical protein